MDTETTAQKPKKFKMRWLVIAVWLLACVACYFAFFYNKANLNKVRLVADTPKSSPVLIEDGEVSVFSPDILKVRVEPIADKKGNTSFPIFNQEVLQDNQQLNSLVNMTPQTKGTWRFSGDNEYLIFKPETDWLPAQKYEVQVSPRLFLPNVQATNTSVSFTTQPNEVTIDEFYVFPSTAKERHMALKGVAHFDYPVDPEAIKGVSLTIDKKEQHPQVKLDERRRVILIDYEAVPITEKDQEAALQIKWGKMSAKSFTTLNSVHHAFNLKEVKILPPARIGETYTLAAEFTDLVNAQKLLAEHKVKVWLLPLDKERVWTEESVESVQKELGKATEMPLKAIPGISSVPSFQITGNLQTRDRERYVFVKFDAGITSQGGFVSNEAKSFILRIKEWPKRLKIVGSGSVLSLKNDHILQFVAQGIDKVEVTVSRIRRGDINHLVSQTNGDISKPCFGYTRSNDYGYDYYDDEEYYDDEDDDSSSDNEDYSCGGYPSFNEYDIAEVFTKKIPLADTGMKPNFFTVDLNNYLSAGNSGVFIIEATDKYDNVNQRRLILISDIGLMYKKEESRYKVFALEISSQQPLANAKVELLARNGTVLKTRYTNERGVADFEIPTNSSPEKKPVAFIVSRGEDYSFIPLNNGPREVNYNRFSTDGQDPTQERNSLDVLLFTDRGIYRPGDSVNFALIAKNKEWSSTAGLPIRLEIDDPRGKKVFDKKVSLPENGLRDFTFATETSSATGEYNLRAYNDANDRYLAGISFEVKEFTEDKLKVKASVQSPANKGWQPLEGMTAQAEVQNMFGTPAVGNPVDLKVRLYPTSFNFSQYSEYTFADFAQSKGSIKQETISFETLTTSNSGEVSQPIDLSSYAKGTYRLVLYAEAFEQESGHSVTAQASLLVSPSPYVVGYKTKADLSYIPQHSRQTVDFLVIDPNLNKIALNNVTVHLFSRQYVSVPVRSGSTFRYQSVLQENLISTQPLRLQKEGSSYTLPTQNPGMYAVELHNAADEKIARVEFMVSGNANVSYNLERSAELRLSLEKETVEPGTTLQFNVTAPFTGIGLITVEKEKVYAYKWFKTTTTSSVQSITLPSELVGSAYLNVSFLRSPDSREILLNPHSYAVAPFYVIPSRHISQIELKTPELIQPGDTLQISYATSVPSQIILYGASEGILQVARYKLPNPISYFFPKLRLGVRTYQMWDLIMADHRILKEVYGIGGDADASAKMMDMQLNPFARKTEKPITFWSNILEASSTPKTYTYQVPDYFNGKIRVMAVAVSPQAAASKQQDVLVRAPLVLSAGAPVVVAPTDIFEASVKVSNNNEQTQKDDVTVKISTSDNLQVVGDAVKTVQVPYKKEATVSFQVKALDGLGNADIKFEAVLAQPQTTAKRNVTLSVRPASAYRVTIDTGSGKGKFTVKQFEARKLYVPFSKRQIAVSPNPLVVALGLGAYLEKFPHGCTEQIVSQTFPTIVFYKSTGNIQAAQDAFERTHKKLQMRQLGNGGFSLWDNGSYVNTYASLYAFHMLTEAEEMGYPVSKNLKERALEWIKQTAKDGSYDNPRYSAYAYYLAARNGVLLTSELYNLEEYLNKNQPDWKNSVTGVYIAAVYKLFQNEEKALQILKSFKPEKNYSFYNDYDSSFARNATYLYIVGMHFPQLLKDKKVEQVLTNIHENIQAKRYNTMTSSLSMLALYAYAQNHSVQAEDIEVYAGNKRLTLTPEKNNILVADFAEDTKSFEIKTKLSAPIYYAITQQGYDNAPVTVTANGLEVSRVYQLPQASGKLGEEVEVKITVKSLKNYVENAVITDLLPGGMSIVPGSLESSGRVDYYDEREDRLLIYNHISTQGTTYTYKVKLTAVGTFKVPAITAAGLYDTSLSASGAEGTFTVKPRD